MRHFCWDLFSWLHVMLVSAVHSAVRCFPTEKNEFMVSFSITRAPSAAEAIDCQIKSPNHLKSNHGLPFLLHGWRLCSVRTDLWFKINSWKIIDFYRKEECYLKKVSEGAIHQEKRLPKHFVFEITPIASVIKLVPRGLWTSMMRGSNFLWIT